jgi:hypothetical protein
MTSTVFTSGTVIESPWLNDINNVVYNNLPTNGLVWKTGTGSPEGVVTAAVGSLYSNTSGGTSTTLYVKTSGTGNTGWTAK